VQNLAYIACPNPPLYFIQPKSGPHYLKHLKRTKKENLPLFLKIMAQINLEDFHAIF
jgi:hypothetical protein